MARARLDFGSNTFGPLENLWLYLFAKRISTIAGCPSSLKMPIFLYNPQYFYVMKRGFQLIKRLLVLLQKLP
jgi:hypothetical protein